MAVTGPSMSRHPSGSGRGAGRAAAGDPYLYRELGHAHGAALAGWLWRAAGAERSARRTSWRSGSGRARLGPIRDGPAGAPRRGRSKARAARSQRCGVQRGTPSSGVYVSLWKHLHLERCSCTRCRSEVNGRPETPASSWTARRRFRQPPCPVSDGTPSTERTPDPGPRVGLRATPAPSARTRNRQARRRSARSSGVRSPDRPSGSTRPRDRSGARRGDGPPRWRSTGPATPARARSRRPRSAGGRPPDRAGRSGTSR